MDPQPNLDTSSDFKYDYIYTKVCVRARACARLCRLAVLVAGAKKK